MRMGNQDEVLTKHEMFHELLKFIFELFQRDIKMKNLKWKQ